MESPSKNRTPLFLTMMSLTTLFTIFCLLVFSGYLGDSPIPYTGLMPEVHYPIFAIFVPTVASMIFIIIFPRLGIPIFLKIKSLIWGKYKNAYIELDFDPPTIKTFFIRSVFVFLLTMGILSTISPFVDYSLFIDSFTYQSNIEEGFPLNYSMDVLAGFSTLILPFSIGLWSIGWAMEDAGLIHYHIPKLNKKYYEIEPIHFKYDSYIGGFAGITAILYYLGAITLYIEDFQNLFWSLMVFLIVLSMNGLSYVIYSQFGVNFARKNITPSKFQKDVLMDQDP